MAADNKDTMIVPVLPLRGLVVFPKALIHFDVGRQKSITAINKAMKRDQMIFLSTQIDATNNDPKLIDVYTTGVIAKIVQVLKQPENVTRIVIEGKFRAKIVAPVHDPSGLMAEVQPIPEPIMDHDDFDTALMRAVKKEFEEYIDISPQIPSDIIFKVALCKRAGELADYIAANMALDYQVKQEILEIRSPVERLKDVLDVLINENYILSLEDEINRKARMRIDESQRDFFLREQKRVIEEELGEDDNPSEDAEEYAERIEELKLDEKSADVLLKECRKLMKMPFGSQEASVIRTYLDTVLDLPWNKSTKDKIVIPKLRKELDRTHYGLEKIKTRIIEQLAVKKLSDKQKGQVICFVGPPGVGKTSIAKSIAEAIGRNSQRIALGGVRDEAEIRGHRRTYIGSIPGRIISAVQSAGSNNPVLILDEVDKLASDYKGDPTSALLEVLDIEQNNKFVDHYIDIPFDLSNVMFITTANDLGAIPAPLRDRMEIIEINSYTREEKFHIAKKHLIPKHDEKEIETLLGNKKYLPDTVSKKDEIGIVNGLAWTSVGGELLPIEVAIMDGTGKLELTGSLGDVMKESAKIAINCIRSHADVLGIDSEFYKNKDIHIHAPEGAVPKDGPSAGITMATAIYSVLSSKAVRHDVAMTGEITLRGKVLPIGGLKEKSMAAYKHGITTVIIPKLNEPDIEEFDDAVKENINFIPVESLKDVLSIAVIDPIKVSEREWNKTRLPSPSANAPVARMTQ